MNPASRKARLLTSLAANSLSGLVKTVKATSRTIHEPPDLIPRLRSQAPFIMAMWHGQFLMLADLNTREFNVAAVVSRHGDGDVVTGVLKKFGITAIRGAGAGPRKRDRGGVYALRASVRALREGSIVAMTADVPVGTPRVAGTGIVMLARLSGRPIIPVAAATSRFLVLNSWSKATVNLPFSTLAMVAGEPLFVAGDADEDAIEIARQKVEISLNHVTERAYALAGSRDAGSTTAGVAPQRD
jgi:3-deoxy-D-manno-octulosonic-acid transferase